MTDALLGRAGRVACYEQFTNRAHEIGRHDRLCDVPLKAGGKCLLPILGARVRGERHGRRRRNRRVWVRAKLAHERIAIFFRHRDIAHNDIGSNALNECEGARGAIGTLDRRTCAGEDLRKQFSFVRSVIDDEDTNTMQIDDLLIRAIRCRPAFGGNANRYLETERRSRANSRAGRDDVPAVRLNNGAHQRESQSKSAMGARDAAVLLPKTIEDVRKERGIDAAPGVAHTDLRDAVLRAEAGLDAPPLRREFDGVRQQIPHGLLQPIRIAQEEDWTLFGEHVQVKALTLRAGTHDVSGAEDDLDQIRRAQAGVAACR